MFRNTAIELVGYIEYAKLKRKYGAECVICACAWEGTGDYYFCGLYMSVWAQRHDIGSWILLCRDIYREEVARLFQSLDKRTLIPDSINDMYWMRFLSKFCDIDFSFFQYNCDEPAIARGVMQMSPPGRLAGYRGLEMLDTYIYGGFDLPRGVTPEMPEFDYDANKINALFAKVRAMPGKTVLIAPYSASFYGYEPPAEFWMKIVDILQQRGYGVLTNCAGKEHPLPGTRPLLVPYALSVPFLNAAGGFIGIRSGLCDIISTTTAKKIILYPYEAQNWPDGTSLAFTGLNHMGLCDDAIELEATPKWGNWEAIAERMLEQFE
jgi:hypothetical protein